MASFEELLKKDGKLVYRTRGVSMLPMLHENRDLVIIRVPVSRLKRYDVALYRREGAYVLHRVIGVEEGYYRILGDNTYAVELVPDSEVIGVLTSFVRKGKTYQVTDAKYRAYVRFWQGIFRSGRRLSSALRPLHVRRSGWESAGNDKNRNDKNDEDRIVKRKDVTDQ